LSTWTTPITFTSSTLTAAQMNTEVRDHLNFLKGALDLITASTTADTGNSTVLQILRSASSSEAIKASVTGDANPRFRVYASGKMEWGDGTAAGDISFERSAAAVLLMNDAFLRVQRDSSSDAAFGTLVTSDSVDRFIVRASGVQEWGDGSAARDVNEYRAAANVLKTDDQFRAVDGITTKIVAGVVSDGSFTATPESGTIAIDTTNSRIYVRVGSTWKFVAVA
jgi:hypothetical protein